MIKRNEMKICAVEGDKPVIHNANDAMDLLFSLSYETGAKAFVLDKELFCDEFFILSTGVAGEITQKFVNYRLIVAIVGDFTGYTSKPLNDYIYEQNRGRHIFFVPSREEAVNKIANHQ